jgi:23S rRNA pseudouridine1911/1915/1917 synthase
MTRLAFHAEDQDSGKRVDIFLAARGMDASRAVIQKWIEEKRVLVNGAATKSAHKLRPGDLVEVDQPETSSQCETLEPWDRPLEFLYEDESLLVVSKPAGIVTHPGAGNRTHTLVNSLIFHRPQLSDVGHPLRPGIVHRLDRETSGLLLVAKSGKVYRELQAMFKQRLIQKHYRALTFGTWSAVAGKIELGLGRDPSNRKKISTRSRYKRTAVTMYQIMRQGGCGALLDVVILTGRTHQIRVHLSSQNHPIVGDAVYGGASWNRIPDPMLRARLRSIQFFGLHAYSLAFSHPVSKAPMLFECPLPEYWNDALKILG